VAAVHAQAVALGLPGLLGPPGRARDLALALVIARMVRPGSKLATASWWSDTTLGVDLGVAEASTEEVSAAMDALLARQDRIENLLAARHLGAEAALDGICVLRTNGSAGTMRQGVISTYGGRCQRRSPGNASRTAAPAGMIAISVLRKAGPSLMAHGYRDLGPMAAGRPPLRRRVTNCCAVLRAGAAGGTTVPAQRARGVLRLRVRAFPRKRFRLPGVVSAYKNLAHVERDCTSKVDYLDLRPIHHRR